MRKTRIGKKIFSILMAQTLVLSLACTGSMTAVQTYAARSTGDHNSSGSVDKEETVYVITDGDGQIDEIIVNDKLNNADGSATIKDKTDLTDIENVKGDEEYTEDSDQDITWNADGNSISYQGKSDKDLPVNVKLSFTLDGQPVSASQLAGKSGKVTIRFDYENKETRKVSVNGKEYEVYVPFTMISGAILDSDRFSNVTVENGKAVTEGDKIIVFGYAVPGLRESLNVDDGILKDVDIDLPEYVEITADVENFELDLTMTAVTNDLLNDLNTKDIDDDEVEEDIHKLEDATDKLVDGTGELADAMGTAYEGTKTIAENMNKVAGGTSTLAQALGLYTNGVGQLYQKVPALTNGMTVLDTGASKLAKGAAALKTGTVAYVDGVDSLAEGLLGDGTTENPGYLAGVEALADGASGLSGLGKLGQVSDAISVMKASTGDEETYTQPDGTKSATLGYGAAAVESGLDQVIQGVDALKESTSGEGLKNLAGSIGQAGQILNSASSTLTDASEEYAKAQSDANAIIQDAAEEIDSQASMVEKARGELSARQDEINGVIGDRNETIASRNKEISGAATKIQDAAEDCNSSIKETVSALKEAKAQLESAKKALKDAETEEVHFKDQIARIEKEINDTQKKIDALEDKKVSGVDVDEIAKISTSEINLDLKDISAEKLTGQGKKLADIHVDPVNLEVEKAALQAIASGISTASETMSTDPLDRLTANLRQIKAGASGVKAGVKALHSSLAQLETATAAFPQAAQGIQALNQGFEMLTQNNPAIRTGAAMLQKNGPALSTGVRELADGSSKLAKGTSELSSGASALVKGVGTLASNNKKLNDGAQTLASGASALAKGSGSLSSGMNKLLEGAQTLKDGMSDYKEEGISKIVDLYNDDILGLKDRFEAIRKAGRDYQTYTQLSDGVKGNVKFIYKSDEIKAEDGE